MLDAATVDPALRRHARRGAGRARRWRLAAVLAVGAAPILAGGWYALRAPAADPQRLLGDSATTLARGNNHAALADAQAAARAGAPAAIVQIRLARAWLELGDGIAAEAALGHAHDAGAPMPHHLLAEARRLQGDADGALAEAARAAPPDRADAARIRALALATRGQLAEGRAALEALVAAAPRDGAAWRDLGRMRLTTGDLDGAARAIARAGPLLPDDPHLLTLTGEVVRARYGAVAALPWFAAALRRDPYDHPALIEKAATLGDLGRYRAMLAATRAALASRPGSPQALYLQAVMAARAGRYDLAARLLDRGGADAAPLPAARLLRGAVDAVASRSEQALAGWRDLVARQPMNRDARRLLAAQMLRAGDAAGALDLLAPMAQRRDADTYTLMLAARAFEARGDRAAAAGMLDRAAAMAGGVSDAFASDDMVATLAAAADAAPGDPTYAIGLIRGWLGSGDGAAALARARALAAASPGAPAAQAALGDTLMLTGHGGDAVAAYARAASLRFDEPALLRLVDAQARAGRSRDAAATLALFLAQNPRDLTALQLLGHVQRTTGQAPAAIATLSAVRARTGSRNVALLVDLAAAHLAVDDAAAALAPARAAYGLLPMNAAICDLYGLALAGTGDLDGARQLLDKAVALAPRDPVVAAHRQRL